jgi:xylulokinase
METGLILGIDVGTTSVKAAALDLTGQAQFAFNASYPTHRPRSGHVEQDPRDWLRLVQNVLAQASAQGNAVQVSCIGLCSQVNTHVFLGQDGQPLAPAILWQDTRAVAEAAELDASVTMAQKIAWWGAPMPIDPSHVLARMLWMSRHRPDVWAKTRWVVLPKDYVVFHLTGEMCSDPLSNIGLVDAKGAPISGPLDLVPGAAERIVPMIGPCDQAGVVGPALPLAGVPVYGTTMDGWAALLGAGGAREGACVYVSGTSEVLGITSHQVMPTPGVIVFPSSLGLQIHAGPTQSGGAAMAWFCQTLGLTPEQMSDLVAAHARASPTPIFLPQLQGERAPLWNADLRGSFFGIDQSTTAADLCRAVYEGVAFSARHVLEALECSAALRADIITCGGGGFRSDVWNQIRANVLGRPLRRLAMNEPGILGAATLAIFGSGAFSSLADAHSALARFERVYDPDPAVGQMYDDLFGIYVDGIGRLADISLRLLRI